MPLNNADIAAAFDEIADLLEIQDANPFRVRAYRNAAHAIQNLGADLAGMVKQNQDLTELPGIGKDLAGKIKELVDTGRCGALDALHKTLPPTISALLKVPGLGPKRVKTLYRQLDVRTLDELHQAACEGRLRTLRGFGEKTEIQIRDAIEAQLAGAKRFTLAVATPRARMLEAYLKATPGLRRLAIAGSFRRWCETVGDLDVVACAETPEAVMQRLADYDEVIQVVARGPTRSTVVLRGNLQIDLRVVPEENFGAALLYFTGSKSHNIAIRRIGQQHGLKINEYGVYKGKRRIAGETEESVYRSVGLRYIEPELRENRSEIEAAREGMLPKLIVPADLRGDLHAHTNATDGHSNLKDMALAARARGLAYLAITDHSRAVRVAHGLDPQRLLKQIDAIDRLNDELEGIALLKGVEVDILEDGALDLPDSLLARLDLVVAAVHSHFDLPRRKQTERILRAMDHPYFTILAHPTGRLLQERAPYDIDLLRIARKARERGCFLELNSQPERLDLPDIFCRMAKEEGVLISVNSDAHSVFDFDHLRYGVSQARRGWLEAADVLNTRPLIALRPLLQRTMSAAHKPARAGTGCNHRNSLGKT